MGRRSIQQETPVAADPVATSRTARPHGPDKGAPVGRRERAKATRRTEIVRAARRLIQTAGEDGFSMQALARAAGVSPMTPYNLFGSKQSIMIAVLDDDLASFEARLARLRVDDLDRIFKTVSLARKVYAAEPNFYRTVFRGAQLGSSSAAGSTRFREPRRALWTALLERAIASGHLRRDLDARLVGPSLSQIVQACVTDWLSGALTLPQFEARAHLGIALLLLGIAAPAARERLRAWIASSRRVLERSRKAKPGLAGARQPRLASRRA